MSLSNIGSTQSQALTGLVAPHHVQPRKALHASPAASVTTTADSSSPLASAVAAALTQLGLIPSATGSHSVATTSSNTLASLPQPTQASKQLQQYRTIASTSSNLAQALSSSLSSATPTTTGASGLTSTFQSLWASVGSSSGASADASDTTMPSLPSFLQTLAHNFSESGVYGLRGVFVDTVA